MAGRPSWRVEVLRRAQDERMGVLSSGDGFETFGRCGLSQVLLRGVAAVYGEGRACHER